MSAALSDAELQLIVPALREKAKGDRLAARQIAHLDGHGSVHDALVLQAEQADKLADKLEA